MAEFKTKYLVNCHEYKNCLLQKFLRILSVYKNVCLKFLWPILENKKMQILEYFNWNLSFFRKLSSLEFFWIFFIRRLPIISRTYWIVLIENLFRIRKMHYILCLWALQYMYQDRLKELYLEIRDYIWNRKRFAINLYQHPPETWGQLLAANFSKTIISLQF